MNYNKIGLGLWIPTILFLQSCSHNLPPYTIQEEMINEAVYAAGEILPEPYAFIQSPSNDVISKICVKPGDVVKEGDILAFLGAAEDDKKIAVLKKQLAIANDALKYQSPILNEIKQEIEAAKKQYQIDEQNAARYAKLVITGSVSKKEAEDVTLKATLGRIAHVKLQQQYDTKVIKLSEDKLQIENLIAQADHEMQRKILRSKIYGKVLSISKKVGESVQPTENIMLIGNDKQFQLKIFIDERDINKVKIGQKIVFETDAYPGRRFHATLRTIDPLINRELRNVKAEATIVEDVFFYPQSAVEANIVVREQKKGVLIPFDYLFSGDTVLLKNGKDIVKQKIFSGFRIGNKVEINKGLNVGDIIYKNK